MWHQLHGVRLVPHLQQLLPPAGQVGSQCEARCAVQAAESRAPDAATGSMCMSSCCTTCMCLGPSESTNLQHTCTCHVEDVVTKHAGWGLRPATSAGGCRFQNCCAAAQHQCAGAVATPARCCCYTTPDGGPSDGTRTASHSGAANSSKPFFRNLLVPTHAPSSRA